jgi:hypothetical protein
MSRQLAAKESGLFERDRFANTGRRSDTQQPPFVRQRVGVPSEEFQELRSAMPIVDRFPKLPFFRIAIPLSIRPVHRFVLGQSPQRQRLLEGERASIGGSQDVETLVVDERWFIRQSDWHCEQKSAVKQAGEQEPRKRIPGESIGIPGKTGVL